MPRSSGFAVKELCEAQDLIAQAAQKVTGARLATIRLSGEGDDFRGTPLEGAIRELAALIPDPEEATTDGK